MTADPSTRTSPQRLPVERWANVVRDAPLVSFDLLVMTPAERVLLGYRENQPARHSWFVPGGVVRKNEPLARAFLRVTHDELGRAYALDDSRLHGVYEHFYDENFRDEPGYGTHYVVMARILEVPAEWEVVPREQHARYRWASVAELGADDTVHRYVRNYFSAAPPR
jgi:colanic acid biosynthesis protein WcaH